MEEAAIRLRAAENYAYLPFVVLSGGRAVACDRPPRSKHPIPPELWAKPHRRPAATLILRRLRHPIPRADMQKYCRNAFRKMPMRCRCTTHPCQTGRNLVHKFSTSRVASSTDAADDIDL